MEACFVDANFVDANCMKVGFVEAGHGSVLRRSGRHLHRSTGSNCFPCRSVRFRVVLVFVPSQLRVDIIRVALRYPFRIAQSFLRIN